MTIQSMKETIMLKAKCNQTILVALIVCCFALAGCTKEYHLTITINNDGSADVQTRYTMDRAQIEQMISWDTRDDFEMYMPDNDQPGWEEVVEEGVVIEEKPGPEVAEPTEPQPLTDEQIIQGFTKLSEENSPLKDHEGVSQEMISVTVDEDYLHAEGKAHFDSLELLVKHGAYYWERAGIDQFRIEKNDAGNIVAIATPDENFSGRDRQLRRILASQKFKGSFRLIMPGKIVSSPLPNTQDNETWLDVDAEDSASLDQLLEMMSQSLQIEAEPGSIDLSVLPLDSEELYEPPVHSESGVDQYYKSLEAVDAPDGYYAEAISLTINTMVLMPGAKEQLGDRLEYLGRGESNTANIRAKLFAPVGQKLLAMSKVEVEGAVDDLGNQIELNKKESPYGMYGYMRHYGGDEEANEALDFNVTLGLPDPEAQAIEEVSGMLEVVAFDDWAEHKIENVRANPDREHDLSDILPGATVKINRYRRHVEAEGGHSNVQGYLAIEVQGGPEVQTVQFEVVIPGSDRISSYTNMDQTNTKLDVTTRTLLLNYHEWMDGVLDPDSIVLVIRYPKGIRRERVPLFLEALDMY